MVNRLNKPLKIQLYSGILGSSRGSYRYLGACSFFPKRGLLAEGQGPPEGLKAAEGKGESRLDAWNPSVDLLPTQVFT